MSTVAAPPAKDTYTPLELFGIDRLLDEDERDIAATVRRFVETRLKPNVEDWFESAPCQRNSPRSSASSACSACTCRATAAREPTPSATARPAWNSGRRQRLPQLRVRAGLVVDVLDLPLRLRGQKNRAARLAAGEAIGCFGLTRRTSANPAGMRTRARRDGSDWVLNGTKMWITNSNPADVATVWAQTDEGSRGSWCPPTPQVSPPTIHKEAVAAGLGDLGVGARQRPPRPPRRSCRTPEGLGAPLSCLNRRASASCSAPWAPPEQPGRPRSPTPQSRDVFDHVRSRAYQLTQEKLANMTVELGRACCWPSTSGRIRTPRVRPEQISLGKLNRARVAGVARECRTLLGGSGITLEYSPLRHAHATSIGADLRGNLRDAPAVDRWASPGGPRSADMTGTVEHSTSLPGMAGRSPFQPAQRQPCAPTIVVAPKAIRYDHRRTGDGRGRRPSGPPVGRNTHPPARRSC